MSWFGKIVGGTLGLFVGGPIGAIGGAALGHYVFDRGDGTAGGGFAGERIGAGRPHPFSLREQAQATYFVALFSMLGKLAKADGTVSRAEGEAFKNMLRQMPLSHAQREFAVNIFNEAKRSPYSIEDFARQFQQITAGRPEIHTQMVDMLYQLAAVDQHLHEQEEAAIRSVSRILGLNDRQVDGIKAKYFDAAGSHYEVLGISPSASDDDVRRAYRELARQYHPDTVVSKGLPEEFVDFAHTRFKEIQAAYEAIKQERGMS
ncbi:MAG: TerB family tellurite resistance protein [Spirochaetaceae bacterium]